MTETMGGGCGAESNKQSPKDQRREFSRNSGAALRCYTSFSGRNNARRQFGNIDAARWRKRYCESRSFRPRRENHPEGGRSSRGEVKLAEQIMNLPICSPSKFIFKSEFGRLTQTWNINIFLDCFKAVLTSSTTSRHKKHPGNSPDVFC